MWGDGMIFNIPTGGKRTAFVAVYGAAEEEVTLSHSKGQEFTFTANDEQIREIPVGVYTVSGSVSGYSKTLTVTKNTVRINAWPDNATVYYWYGYAPIGEWKATAALPSGSPYTSNPTKPTVTVNTNSVVIKSAGDYARGGTAYLPKTTIVGTTMMLVCSGASNNYYLSLNLTGSLSNKYTVAASKSISSGATSVELSIESISGGSYYPAISLNTARYESGSTPSKVTVKALYSV